MILTKIRLPTFGSPQTRVSRIILGSGGGGVVVGDNMVTMEVSFGISF